MLSDGVVGAATGARASLSSCASVPLDGPTHVCCGV